MQPCFRWVADVCHASLLDEKWLLAPSLQVGHQWKAQINRAGQPTLNLLPKTIHSIVRAIIDAERTSSQIRVADDTLRSVMIQHCINELHQTDRFRYYHQLETLDTLGQIAARTLGDLAMASVSADQIIQAKFESADASHDLALLVNHYHDQMQELGVVDEAEALRRAISAVEQCGAEGGELLAEAKILVPQTLTLSRLEERLLDLLRHRGILLEPEAETEIAADPLGWARRQMESSGLKFDVAIAVGEVNEVQAVLRRLAKENTPLDHAEVLYTDRSTYAPLVFEFMAAADSMQDVELDQLPVTFAEGIDCVYSRAGRALRTWIRWIENDYPQSLLVQMLRDGFIDVAGKKRSGFGHVRLASQLRKLPIGFGRDRYLSQIETGILRAKQRIAEIEQDAEAESDEEIYDHGLAVLEELRDLIASLLRDTPTSKQTSSLEDQATVLTAAEFFLNTWARRVNRLDQLCSSAMRNKIQAMKVALQSAPVSTFDVCRWLRELPIKARVLTSGPKPGCLHVEHINRSGHSGRAWTFMIGLDDSRYPKSGGQDPLLLDHHRQLLDPQLPTSTSKRHLAQNAFHDVFARGQKRITLVYSDRSLVQDKKLFASSALLDVFRRLVGPEDASEQDVYAAAGPAECFVSDPSGDLTAQQTMLRSLLSIDSETQRQTQLESRFAFFADGRRFEEQLSDPAAFSRARGLVVDAGADLDPTRADAKSVSATKLEEFGACPRRYFFQQGLRIRPPAELEIDPGRWLQPLVSGGLIHSVFEEFLIELTSAGLTPNYSRDRDHILKILATHIAEVEAEVPIHYPDAYQKQLRELEDTCEIFLRREEEYCDRTGAKPFVMEAKFGVGDLATTTKLDSAEPIDLTLDGGKKIRVSGVLDRVDRVSKGESELYWIWDYKSGSDYGFDAGDPIQNGRKLQPLIYLSLLRHRLHEVESAEGEVAQFGYFFPSPRTNGRRLAWSTEQIDVGKPILQKIVDLISAGAFIATDQKNDCAYCDYLSICGNPEWTASDTKTLLETSADPLVHSIGGLR